LKEVIDTAAILGIPQDKAEGFYYQYKPQGWLWGNGQPITELRSGLMRWKLNQFKFEKPKSPIVDSETTRKQREAQICEEYDSYLRQKTTQALKDLKKDKGHIAQVAGWLIDEILKERAQ
ncbi:unnamed protein product, partial [marine sediment metagenome]